MSKKVGNGIRIYKLDKYQEASYYADQARKPDSGILAVQVKASADRWRKVQKVLDRQQEGQRNRSS